MEKNSSSKNESKYTDSTNHSICEKFDKVPFPVGQFCPPQKDEFIKRICNKNCRDCPFFWWPIPGPPGRDGRDGKDGTNGTDGTDGTDGITPTIGANGNWWIGETDTGIPARGQDGTNGTNGADGADGTDGITPTIGANGNWWIGETDTGIPARGQDGADGTDGITPTIGANGNWWIGETDTGIPARGQDGTNGTNGTDGTDGITPTIGANGNWWIGETDTGIPARGQDGTNGTNGADGATGPAGPQGPQGPPGTFNASSLFVWKADQQTLDPAASTGEIGDAVAFTDSVVGGTALSFTSPAEINILESGYYSIRWEIYKSGYDSAFALFVNSDGSGAALVPGSNYGALSHDERYSGQAIGVLTADSTLTLNCISTIYPQEIQNEVSNDVLVTGASIIIIKIS